MENKVLSVFFGSDLLPYKDSERTVHYPITGNAFAGSHNTNEIHFYVDEIGGTSGVSWVIVSKLPNGKLGYEPLSNVASDSDLGEDYLIFDLSSYYTQYKGVVKLALRGYQGTITFDYDSDSGTYTISGDPLIEVTGTIDLAINYSPFVNTGSISQDNATQIIAAMSNYLPLANGIVVVSSLPSDLSGYNEGQIIYNKGDNKYYILSSGAFVEYYTNVEPITTYDYSDTALQGIKINGEEYRLAQLGTVNSNNDLALGRSSRASYNGVALGYGAIALSQGSIAIGHNSGVPSDNNYGIAIGYTAQATEPYSIAIGFNAVNDAINSIVIGGSAENYIPRTISFDSTDQVANYQKTLVLYSPEKIFFRNGFIDSSYTSLDDYTNGETLQDLLDEKGASISLSMDTTTYVLTLSLLDANNNVISTQQVDLPLESTVVSGSYDNANKELVLTLTSGQTISVPIGDLVDGLVSETRTIAGIDLQDNITSQELTDALTFMNDTTDLDYVMGEE